VSSWSSRSQRRGKTTFLRSLNRLVEPTAGTIRVAGRAVTGAGAPRFATFGVTSAWSSSIQTWSAARP